MPNARVATPITTATIAGARRRHSSGTTWTATNPQAHQVMASLVSSRSVTAIDTAVTTPTTIASSASTSTGGNARPRWAKRATNDIGRTVVTARPAVIRPRSDPLRPRSRAPGRRCGT